MHYNTHKSTRYKNSNSAKIFPELYGNRENCCGCSACYAICPVHAISMEPDEEGFLYPTVDVKKCIQCRKCIGVCAFKRDQYFKGYIMRENVPYENCSNYKREKYNTPRTYAVKHRDYDTRMASRSGGIFTALSDKVLADGGAVYGCSLDDDFAAFHIKAEAAEERNRMRGSKYIQSEIRDIFFAVKKDLDNNREVLSI